MKIISKSLAETEKFARKFLEDLKPKQDGATVVGFYGDLGSGKTTFVQAIGRQLGIKESIQSPTFVIMKKFIIHNSNFKFFFHLDAYRLDSGEELQKLGFNELLTNSKNLILIEWANQVADILPANHLKLSCQFVDENTREFTL